MGVALDAGADDMKRDGDVFEITCDPANVHGGAGGAARQAGIETDRGRGQEPAEDADGRGRGDRQEGAPADGRRSTTTTTCRTSTPTPTSPRRWRTLNGRPGAAPEVPRATDPRPAPGDRVRGHRVPAVQLPHLVRQRPAAGRVDQPRPQVPAGPGRDPRRRGVHLPARRRSQVRHPPPRSCWPSWSARRRPRRRCWRRCRSWPSGRPS